MACHPSGNGRGGVGRSGIAHAVALPLRVTRKTCGALSMPAMAVRGCVGRSGIAHAVTMQLHVTREGIRRAIRLAMGREEMGRAASNIFSSACVRGAVPLLHTAKGMGRAIHPGRGAWRGCGAGHGRFAAPPGARHEADGTGMQKHGCVVPSVLGHACRACRCAHPCFMGCGGWALPFTPPAHL